MNGLSGGQYSVNKNIRFKTPMPRSVLSDYRDTYIFVKETIDLLLDFYIWDILRLLEISMGFLQKRQRFYCVGD